MKYGNIVEPMIKDMLKKMYPQYLFESCGFIEYSKYMGSTPDGKVFNGLKNIGLEIKAACSYGTLYDRMVLPFEQSHTDFWQIQTEMLCLGTDELMYVVAEPSEDIFNPKINNLEIKFLNNSETHQKCIIQRSEIASKAIELYLSGTDFNESIQIAVSNYEIKS